MIFCFKYISKLTSSISILLCLNACSINTNQEQADQYVSEKTIIDSTDIKAEIFKSNTLKKAVAQEISFLLFWRNMSREEYNVVLDELWMKRKIKAREKYTLYLDQRPVEFIVSANFEENLLSEISLESYSLHAVQVIELYNLYNEKYGNDSEYNSLNVDHTYKTVELYYWEDENSRDVFGNKNNLSGDLFGNRPKVYIDERATINSYYFSDTKYHWIKGDQLVTFSIDKRKKQLVIRHPYEGSEESLASRKFVNGEKIVGHNFPKSTIRFEGYVFNVVVEYLNFTKEAVDKFYEYIPEDRSDRLESTTDDI